MKVYTITTQSKKTDKKHQHWITGKRRARKIKEYMEGTGKFKYVWLDEIKKVTDIIETVTYQADYIS